MRRAFTITDAGRAIDARRISQLAADVARTFNPEKVILFGSYAYGRPTEDSDVDLLIVTPHRGPGHRMATQIRLAVAATFPMDLLVRSAAELRSGVRQHDWFIVEILEKGITLHDRADPAVGIKGRSRLRRRLASAAITIEPAWQIMQPELAALTDAAVEFRYPDTAKQGERLKELPRLCFPSQSR